MDKKTQYLHYKDFLPSLKKLFQHGGKFEKAGKLVEAAWGRARSDGAYSHDEVFRGLTLTNHGESRIKHCRKYDLTGYARLVTSYSNDICLFLFAGIHDDVEEWLDRNKGIDFVAREINGRLLIDPVFVSDTAHGIEGVIHSTTDWMINGPIIDQLHDRYKHKLLGSLDGQTIKEIESIESHTDENDILDIASRIKDASLSDAVLDVLLALRSSDRTKAKNRIDLYTNSVKPVTALSPQESDKIVSSDSARRVQDLPAVLFQHFVQTANFRDWMLFLHPAQQDIVDKDFNGPARITGVSGSGKTCVVIHRASRLAESNPNAKVLVLTLNDSLAKLIRELLTAKCGTNCPNNISVKSVFELCFDKLLELEPAKRDYYSKRTITKNQYATPEHIDDIWDEYYHCRANFKAADELFDVVRTLLVRNIYPQDYLRQEFDYIRSAFTPNERHNYLEMERSGRVFPLDKRYRDMVLKGLSGWERKMEAVGAIDDIGIVTALHKHLESLAPEYDHVLVDEVQDLGTLELQIIRKLTKAGQNDLLLCGDAAQTVHTKFSEMKAAGIDLPSARWIKLHQNYRNSRQILTAAHTVLTRSLEKIPAGTTDIEILPPEYANFTSANPLLLKASSVQEELTMAVAYAKERLASGTNKKACIALCGYTQTAVEELGKALNLPALSASTDLSNDDLFISDLEQTKGFEFDHMLILNCSDNVIPHPQLPENESFRELCKLYVALTRAKVELIVSHNGDSSRFIEVAKEYFNEGEWATHVEEPTNIEHVKWPSPALKQVGVMDEWQVPGKTFLRMREAVGLSQTAQDEILSHVTGTAKTEGKVSARRQTEWKDFASFYNDMGSLKKRTGIISEEVWKELLNRFEPIIKDRNLKTPVSPEEIITSQSKKIANDDESDKSGIIPPNDTKPSGYKNVNGKFYVYRHEDVLGFGPISLSAYEIACFLVAQGVEDIQDLDTAKLMRRSILEFLLPRKILNEWIIKGRLRINQSSPGSLVFNPSGLEECKSRIRDANAASGDAKIKPGLSEDKIEDLRKMILFGAHGKYRTKKFARREFEV